MFLKSLTLKGFKSFAEPTTLEFEPGITVVVGPNGSGKSNLVDAVAWVLGAQGPRALRSAKMEDVIFAGTPKRPALGRAEVSLTIDNASGLLPIEFSEVTITRTLWRSGESEYALNGVPCRLLDIQELLSDTGVGRQQHVIVGQGQLDAVLNAVPVDRRMIIEEAAGVLKFRRRRERAQRRLEATEGNLLRVQDLLREVRRQLKPLERQADAARRHDAVAAELSVLRRYLVGRELTGLEARARAVGHVRSEAAAGEARVLGVLSGLDEAVVAAEGDLAAAADDALTEVLGRAERLREVGRGLSAVVVERKRSVAALRDVELDSDVVATLEAEAAGLVADRDVAETEANDLAPQASEIAAAEAQLAAEVDALRAADEGVPFDRSDTGAPQRGPAAAEVRGELSAMRNALALARTEEARLAARLSGVRASQALVEAEASRASEEVAAAERVRASSAELAEAGVLGDAETAGRLSAAEAAAADAVTHHRGCAARVEALALALDEAHARAGAERLAGTPGLIGTIADVVDVAPGWEAAFEAGIGEAGSAVLMDGVEAARRALAGLSEQGLSGAVLPVALSPGRADSSPPVSRVLPGLERLRGAVRGRVSAVEPLLDRLLANVFVVEGGWEEALEASLACPSSVVVSRAGDRFGPTGWHTGAGALGSTRAALERARAELGSAEGAFRAAVQHVHAMRATAEQAKAALAESVERLERDDRQLLAATERLRSVEARAHDLATEADTLVVTLEAATAQTERARERVEELEMIVPALEAEETAGLEREVAMQAARARLDQRRVELRSRATALEVRLNALDERRSALTRRLAEIEERLAHHRGLRSNAGQRRRDLDMQTLALRRLERSIATALGVLEDQVSRLRAQRRRQALRVREIAERLESLRRQRTEAEHELSATRERAQRAEVEEAEIRMRLEATTERIRAEFDCEPTDVVGAACPELPPGTTPEHRVRELERDLRLMGPINPLALEEFDALQERHAFLGSQLDDVKASRRELAKVIRAVDAEIVEVFSAAYADVADSFSKLFSTLFPGGTGRLRLTDPDNLLEAGIEVEARPLGKNVKRLSLLSGGERSLVALAFLFAVFRSRPSPFYLMDEVEAALDDVNLHRFLDLIHEFRDEAQLVIASHQKRTMEAADCLYGVTMQPGGSSKVVSERVSAGAR